MANIFKSKYTGEQIEEILDKSNNITDITPNPETEATDDLNTITIGGVTYRIKGGSTVEANPSADATEELTKLKVGDIIYSIPQGSGSGGEELFKHIYNVYASPTSNFTMSLICNNSSGYSSFNDVPRILTTDMHFSVFNNYEIVTRWEWRSNNELKIYSYNYNTNSTNVYTITSFDAGSYEIYNMSGSLIKSGSYGSN